MQTQMISPRPERSGLAQIFIEVSVCIALSVSVATMLSLAAGAIGGLPPFTNLGFLILAFFSSFIVWGCRNWWLDALKL